MDVVWKNGSCLTMITDVTVTETTKTPLSFAVGVNDYVGATVSTGEGCFANRLVGGVPTDSWTKVRGFNLTEMLFKRGHF